MFSNKKKKNNYSVNKNKKSAGIGNMIIYKLLWDGKRINKQYYWQSIYSPTNVQTKTLDKYYRIIEKIEQEGEKTKSHWMKQHKGKKTK